MMRLADKTAMRIMSISRAVRGGPATPAAPKIAEPDITELGIGAATEPPPVVEPAAPVGPIGAELGAAPVDQGTILQGGNMFSALAKGT